MKEDKLIYKGIGTILKIGIVVWIACTIIMTVIGEFLEN